MGSRLFSNTTSLVGGHDFAAVASWPMLRTLAEGPFAALDATRRIDVAARLRAEGGAAIRVLTRIVTELDGSAPRGSAVARLFDSLVARQPASIGGLVARAMPDGWSVTKAPVRRA